MPWGSIPTAYHAKMYETRADDTSIEEQLAVLADFVKEGKVRAIGLSNESPWGMMKFAHASETAWPAARPVGAERLLALVNRTFEAGAAEVSVREDISLLAYSPLAQGYLTAKYRNGARPAGRAQDAVRAAAAL